MNINVLLPASLETEYINEIKTWGEDKFNIDRNIWRYVSNKYTEKYNYGSEELKEIKSMAKAKLKFSAQNEFGEDTDEFKENLKKFKISLDNEE